MVRARSLDRWVVKFSEVRLAMMRNRAPSGGLLVPDFPDG